MKLKSKSKKDKNTMECPFPTKNSSMAFLTGNKLDYSRPSTPIKNVICNTYADEQAELKKERDAVYNMLQKDNKKSPPKV